MSKPNIPEGGFKHTMLDPQFGKLVPDDFPDERDAILTGIKVPEDDQYSFFSCSC